MFGFGRKKPAAGAAAATLPRSMPRDLFGPGRTVMNAAATVPLGDPNARELLFGPWRPGVSPETAMTHAAFYACVRIIANSIAMLDLVTYRVDPSDGHRERDATSPPARLISTRPNPRYSPTMLWRAVVADMLRHGNGIVWISRKNSGEPQALEYIPWLRTSITLTTIGGEPAQWYGLTRDNGEYVRAPSDDVLHIPGSPVWQINRAMSPLTAYAMSAGIAIGADAFAEAYFRNAAQPGGYLKYPKGFVNKDKADEVRALWRETFGGANFHAGPAILVEGGEYVQLPLVNAADAQLLDARRFSVSDIGRIFGVPDNMLNSSEKATSFGKGLEEQTQSFVDFTLGPHMRAIEDEINYKLVRQSTKIAEFDREGFVRGDLKSRMDSYQVAVGGAQGPGCMTVNEVRQRLNLGRSKDPAADRLITWPSSPTSTAPDEPGAQDIEPETEPTSEKEL